MDEMLQQEQPEKCLLLSLDTGEYDIESSLSELAELARTAGAVVDGVATQKRDTPDSATCFGSGRLTEIAEICAANAITLVIVDRELTATQHRNMEDILPCRVIDRTMLILDIFASRARSAEGRLQVELAQLQYLLPRLAGQGAALSRLGGGIGTRGPGETKLESDRRHIRRRIQSLKNQLAEVEKRRGESRKRRKKDDMRTVAIVGYTNAGKSTLLNRLTDAGVLAEDMLFATLDTTTRALQLPDGRTVLLIDTVGLIQRLPHHLVQAFHATLEEAAMADLVVNLCDASGPYVEHQQIATDLMQSLGRGDKPILRVMNKCDLLPDGIPASNDERVYISAVTGEGIPALLQAMAKALPPDRRRVKILFPFAAGALAEMCRKDGAVEQETWVENGLEMTVTVSLRMLHKLEEQHIHFESL